MHGFKPFENTKEDNIKLQEFIKKAETKPTYKYAISVWTIFDVNKRNWAKDHDLNFLEFFNKEQFLDWYNSI